MPSNSDEPAHRGRLQAQGGGTQKDEPWAQETPPTVSEVLTKSESLEAKLTAREKMLRDNAFTHLRKFIIKAGETGGINADQGVFKKSFPSRPVRDIRVDMDVFKGIACIPDRDK